MDIDCAGAGYGMMKLRGRISLVTPKPEAERKKQRVMISLAIQKPRVGPVKISEAKAKQAEEFSAEIAVAVVRILLDGLELEQTEPRHGSWLLDDPHALDSG